MVLAGVKLSGNISASGHFHIWFGICQNLASSYTAASQILFKIMGLPMSKKDCRKYTGLQETSEMRLTYLLNFADWLPLSLYFPAKD
jgi:hypothetical protein